MKINWLDQIAKSCTGGGGWLAQSVEHVTRDLGIMNLSPTSHVELTLKK